MAHSLILIDDHALLRSGIKSWIESHSDFSVAFEVATYSECAEIEKSLKASGTNGFIAVVDISFKPEASAQKSPTNPYEHEEYTGFEIIRRFTALGVPCVAFSSHDSGGFVERAMSRDVGARAFVSKTAEQSVLLAALNSVANGGTYIQAELVSGLLEVRDISQTFTKKERLVADALTIYNTNADVARELGLSEKTVVNYLTILYDKAGVQSKIQFLEKMGRL